MTAIVSKSIADLGPEPTKVRRDLQSVPELQHEMHRNAGKGQK